MDNFITDITLGFFQEIVLFSGILLYFFLKYILKKSFYKCAKWLVLIIISITAVSMLKVQIMPDYYFFNSNLISNLYVVIFKFLILLAALFIVLISKNTVLKKHYIVLDFYSLFLLTIFSSFCLISSNNFLVAFLSLAFLSLSTGLLITFAKINVIKFSAIKYFVSNILSLMIFLFGVSFLFLSTGTTSFTAINDLLIENTDLSPFFNIGSILVLLGLTFQLGIIPFSNRMPDIYEKMPLRLIITLSIIPVLSTFCIFSRLMVFVFQYTPILQALTYLLGLFTISKGVFGILKQDNFKRYMGYSMMIQSGYIILGFSITNAYATSTALFYILSYIFTLIACFSGIILFNNVTGKMNISDLSGLAYKDKIFAFFWAISFFSFAGLPITSGFIAKIYLFEAIAKCGKLYLAFLFITMLISILSIIAYFRPVNSMFVSENSNFVKNAKLKTPKYILYFSVLVVIFICLCPDRLIQLCQFVAYQL